VYNLNYFLEVQRLHADIVVQRAAAGVTSNALKQSILEVERHFEKVKRIYIYMYIYMYIYIYIHIYI
jgi:hypothetical protein